MACGQAPVPYLNRAIAEEQLGVNAAGAGRISEAEQHYEAAIQVPGHAHAHRTLPAQSPSCVLRYIAICAGAGLCML